MGNVMSLACVAQGQTHMTALGTKANSLSNTTLPNIGNVV
jgi:hypothetical protein